MPGSSILARWWLVCLLLSACATPPSQPALTPAEQADRLAAVQQWRVLGRVAFKAGDEGGKGVFDWQFQRGSWRLMLRGALGQGAVEIWRDEQGVWLRRAGAAPVFAHDVQGLVARETGWRLPLVGLQHWLLGLPDNAAGPVRAVRRDGAGRLLVLEQGGWQIHYDRWRRYGDWLLPARLRLQREDVRLRLVIDRWEIPG